MYKVDNVQFDQIHETSDTLHLEVITRKQILICIKDRFIKRRCVDLGRFII